MAARAEGTRRGAPITRGTSDVEQSPAETSCLSGRGGAQSSGGSDCAQDGGVALAAATAQRHGAGAAAATLELVEQRQRQAVTAHADRVTEGDRAAVDVDAIEVDAECLCGCLLYTSDAADE